MITVSLYSQKVKKTFQFMSARKIPDSIKGYALYFGIRLRVPLYIATSANRRNYLSG